MSQQQGRAGRPGRRVRWDWRARSTSGLLGLAAGMGVNVVSNDVGYRGVAAAFAAGAALAASTWLRSLPPRARLVRWCSRVLLGAALLAALIAGLPFTPRPWFGYATATAVILVAAAVLLPTDTWQALMVLFGSAFIGVGIAFIGAGVAALRTGHTLGDAALIGGGIAFIGAGVAFLRDSGGLLGAAFIGLGIAAIGFGAAALRTGHPLFGVAFIGAGIAGIILGAAALRDSDVLGGTACIGVGIAGIVLGVAALRGNDVLFGAACIGFGIAAIGFGVRVLADTGVIGRMRARFVALVQDPDGQDDADG